MEAARELLRQDEDLQVRPLARKAGVSVGTVYNAFPTIDDLILALAADCWNGVAEVLKDSCGDATVPLEAVAAALKVWASEPENLRFLHSMNRHPAMHRIFPLKSAPTQALKNVQHAIAACLQVHYPVLEPDVIERMAISYTLLFRFLQSGLGEQMALSETEEERFPLIVRAFEELAGFVSKGIEHEYHIKGFEKTA
jgi:AcrR family transcriptional regulator